MLFEEVRHRKSGVDRGGVVEVIGESIALGFDADQYLAVGSADGTEDTKGTKDTKEGAAFVSFVVSRKANRRSARRA